MSNPHRQPPGVPTGGQFAPSSRDESGLELTRPRTRRCPDCFEPVVTSCVNPECRDFNMSNPDARFTDLSIRAHAIQPDDVIVLEQEGTTVRADVSYLDIDPPGRSGRIATIHTKNHGSHRFQINESLPVTRQDPEPDPWEDYDEGPSCSICDGSGHGYPGGPPCPLEVNEVQRYETDQEEHEAAWLMAASDEGPF